jgi:hypothetical protein
MDDVIAISLISKVQSSLDEFFGIISLYEWYHCIVCGVYLLNCNKRIWNGPHASGVQLSAIQ